MKVTITLKIKDAEPDVLNAALNSAFTFAAFAQKYGGDVDKHALVCMDEVSKTSDPVPAPPKTPSRKRKAKAEAKTAEPKTEPEVLTAPAPAAEAPAPAPAAAPEPEAAPQQAADTLTLEDVRREFTRVATAYPEGRKAINSILIEAEARSLNDLTPDKFSWALDKLNAWTEAQS